MTSHAASGQPAAVVLTGTSPYTENFDSLGSGLPSGWGVYTGATSSSIGTTASFSATTVAWSDSAGAFKNVASANISSSSTTPQQTADTDRALGLRQTGAFGDPGASFDFHFNSTGVTVNSISIDLLMLSVQTRSTTFSIQYGIGSSPSSWTTLGSYTDPATFGTTPFSFSSGLSALTNQADAWFRVVALSASSGAGSRDTVGIDNFSIAFAAAAAARVWNGGSGTWQNNQPGNFDGGMPYVNSTTVPVTFQGAGATVGVSGAVVSGDVTFSTGGYTLTGGISDSLTLGTGFVSVTNSGDTATINTILGGSSGLTKAGNGTLILGGANNFTGTVGVNAGVLSVAADTAFGDSGNAINLGGGTLQTTAGFSSARSIAGTGSLDIASGTTLTSSGTFNPTGLTLTNTGTLALTGSAPTVGGSGLTFTQAGTVNATANGLTLGGNLTANNTSGTATVSGATSLGSSARTFSVAGGGTLSVGDLAFNSASTLRVTKTGTGTLQLGGGLTNAGTGLAGIAIGVTNSVTDTGTVQIGTKTALGTAQTFFNSGTLQATADLTGANALAVGVSFGARSAAPATLTGSNIEFAGASGFFEGGAGTVTRVNVNNTTTLSGTVTQSGTAGDSIDIGGSGKLVISSSAAAVTRGMNLVSGSGVTLALDATAGGAAGTYGGAVAVNNTTTLTGNGTVSGAVSVNSGGTIAPGNSPGTLTTGATTFAGGGNYAWQFFTDDVGTGYDTISAASLTITADSTNKFNLLLTSLSSASTPGNNTTFDTSGPRSYTLLSSGVAITTLLPDQFNIDTTNFIVNGSQINSSLFSVGLSGNDLVLIFTPTPVPEPGTVLGVAAAGLGLVRLTRRRRAAAAAETVAVPAA